MAKGQKGIFITDPAFLVLNQAKKNFEALTGGKFSWSAYLAALAIGSLGTYAIKGYSMRCQNCGGEMDVRLVRPSLELEKASEEPSPASSRERPGR